MKKPEGVAHLATWAAIVAMVASVITFYEGAHEDFATYAEIVAVESAIEDCVTQDELTIKLLQWHEDD